MQRDDFMRRVLWTSAAFNVGGALLFAFPESVGQLAGLPTPVPRVYTASLVLFILLFAGAYAWLASQARIDRPMVAFAAIGKSGFFAVMLLCWLFGEATGRGVLGAFGDLAFATIFAWWLLGEAPAPVTEQT